MAPLRFENLVVAPLSSSRARNSFQHNELGGGRLIPPNAHLSTLKGVCLAG
jgi:hypothetical protein